MDTLLFLDLEETVIESWQNPLLCNISKVKKFLADFDTKDVRIFSFAVWNENDRREFDFSIKGLLERAFDVNIVWCPTLEEITKEVASFTGCRWELHEISSVWGKHRTFIDFCTSQFSDIECVLLDDVVPNLELFNKDKNLKIRLVNVTQL